MARSRKKSGSGSGPNKKLPLNQSIPLGIQHVFAMFAGNITVPLIVAGVFGVTTQEKIFLIQMALFAAGVATIIQNSVWPVLIILIGFLNWEGFDGKITKKI